MSDTFGSVAVSCRIGSVPEPAFFQSWTSLLIGGLLPGDTVLEPAYGMAPHKAANKIAAAFLASDQDTLLMVDDDMTFGRHDLDNLRGKEENKSFDIVSGLCTTRRFPPRALVMRLLEEQPPAPLSSQGDFHFDYEEFEVGDTIRVDTAGLAFTLIRRRVFEAMIGEHGIDYAYFFKYGRGRETEDIPFCRDARGLGFSIAVDSNVQPGHIGRHAFTYADVLAYRAKLASDGPKVSFDAEALRPILEAAAAGEDDLAQEAREILMAINMAAGG